MARTRTSKISLLDASEKELENSIMEFLRYQVGVFAFKVNTIGVYDARIGAYRKTSKYLMNGTPDIIACVNHSGIGVFVGMEVKSDTGRQSKDQKEFQELIQDRSNGYYFIVRSIQDAKRVLEDVRYDISKKINSITIRV